MIFFMVLIFYSSLTLGSSYSDDDTVLCLDEEEVKQYFVNESCRVDGDCYNFVDNSTICKQGHCACKEDFIVGNLTTVNGEWKLVCNNPPGPDEPCNTVCQKPYTCTNNMTFQNSSDTAMSQINAIDPFGQKICVCLAPYIGRDGYCVLECKPDEYFSQDDLNCKKRCLANEVYSDDGVCKKVANLSEPCEVKKQCAAPFATCENGKCVCMTGFTQNKNKTACETTSWSCPVGKPSSGAVIKCVIKKGNAPGLSQPMAVFSDNDGPQSDTCGSGHFCYGYSEEATSGHCCPTFKPTCPIGKPHPHAVCAVIRDDTFPPQKSPNQTMTNGLLCPSDTHACSHFSYGDGLEFDLCCPIPCSTDQVLISGRCYPRRQYGDQCQFSDQCDGHNGICVAGVCICRKNNTAQGPPFSKYCVPMCSNGQALQIDGRCVDELKIGDKCDPLSTSVCPSSSHCSQKSNKCVCDCGQIKLDDFNCGPPPECNILYNNSMAPNPNASPLFCVVPTDDSPLISAAVARCPSGQYCGSYLPHLGICCPIPDQPLCADGTIASKECTPTSEKPCDDDLYCLKYLDMAGPDDYIVSSTNIGFACCPFPE